MAVIFLLVVFVLAQFLMGRLLAGRNEDLIHLQTQNKDLASRLQIEQDAATELRNNLARLNASLATITGQRDDLKPAPRQAARDHLGSRLTPGEDEQRRLQRTLDDTKAQQQDSEQRAASLQRELEQARQLVTADRAQVETQLAQLVQLRRDIDALTKARAD